MGRAYVSQLGSERVAVSSPMSFAGSARRLWRMTWTDSPVVKWALAVPAALLLIGLAWTVIAGWYLLFGLLVFPWRLLRRGSRKRKRDELRHREVMQAAQGRQWPPG